MMESSLFLVADDQLISLEQALRYLKSAGKLEFVLWEIMRQHVLLQELQILEGIEISADLIEQMVIAFRLECQLTNSEMFQKWLASEGLDYATFRNKMAFDFKLKRLKAHVTEPNVQEYFIEHKIHLDRVVLSRLVVEEQALAEELKSKILEDGDKFEQLVQEYSVAEERIVNGMMGPVSRGAMPDILRASVDSAKPGDLIGPLEIEELWYLVRVEKLLPAALDEQMKQELENELFEQWLEDKVKKIDAKLQVEF